MLKIVAPAGDMERFYSAVKGGANEVYMGLIGFGARRNAINFTLAEYIEAIEYAHRRNVKVFLTLNTIMRDSEIEALYQNVRTLYENGLDAIIVQDLGLFRFLKTNFKDMDIHGSTQMTVGNAVEANFLQELGFSRVVLARELSFDEIKEIREKTSIELEIFVSGALCISYSGNCYLSSFIGGRSGNRGLCAQPCRKVYTNNNTDEENYLLSPKDQFYKEDEIAKLKEIGIDSIKVEGRMKSPEYVFETVSYYRDVIDGLERKSNSDEIFNRGYSKGYFYGATTEIMNKNYASDFGIRLGILRGKKLTLEEDIILGDGISFVSKDYEKLDGEYVGKLRLDGQRENVKKAKKGDVLYFDSYPRKSKFLYKTYSKEVMDSVKSSLKKANYKSGINGEFFGKVGEKARLEVSVLNNRGTLIKAEIQMDKPLEEAQKNPMTQEKLKEKLMETGDTPYKFDEINVTLEGNVFLPISVLKNLRREVLEELEEKLFNSYKRIGNEEMKYLAIKKSNKKEFDFGVVVRNENQFELLKKLGVENVYLRQAQVARQENLHKIDTEKQLATTLYHAIEGSKKMILNWNLNITNTYSLSEVKKLKNIEKVIISPELNHKTIASIGEVEGIKKCAVVYGKLLGMYIELPLVEETKEVRNKERDNLILRKNDLSNTEITLDQPMNVISKIDELLEVGIDEVIIEITDESEEEIKELLENIEKREGEYIPYNYERGVY